MYDASVENEKDSLNYGLRSLIDIFCKSILADADTYG